MGAARDAEAETAPSGIAMPQGTVALVGRTLLVLAGAYVARALTDARAVPAGVGVALGLAYAVVWQLMADREARAARRRAPSSARIASSLIAFPLVWEATARFGCSGPGPPARPWSASSRSASVWRGASASPSAPGSLPA